jgi:hypothetical protein
VVPSGIVAAIPWSLRVAETPVELHESRDLHPRGVALGAAVVIAGVIVSALVGWLYVDRGPAPPWAPSSPLVLQPAGPALQTDARADLAAFLRAKRARLEGRSVDSASGQAHIPIEEAMDAMVARDAGAGEKP